ncbi:hypothetical protein [Microbispora sp. NBRC 16548]|uniref:hypothetical protein n=1 Tax=Microbispora sp. NBRC 16548 TaxID=3030994 RepID=UPI002554BDE2|nr:hypothetical protein [Microbispora sp. NBRC 16548]
MRCLLTASDPTSTAIPEVLASLGIDFISSRDLSVDWLTEEVPGIDFVCAVLEGAEHEEPPAIYVEIGVALGRKLPLILFSQPARPIPLAIAGLHRVEVDLDNADAISLHMRQFARRLRRVAPRRMTFQHPGSSRNFEEQSLGGRNLEDMRQRLDDLISQGSDFSGERWRGLLRQYEIFLRDLFVTEGAQVSTVSAGDEGYDLAAWVDGASQVVGGPVLLQAKFDRHISSNALEVATEHLAVAMARRALNFAIIIYCDLAEPLARKAISRGFPVVTLSAYELIERLAEVPLKDVIVNLRNELIHRPRAHGSV